MPGSMDWGGTYQNCESDDGAVPGVYGQSTYSQVCELTYRADPRAQTLLLGL